MYFADSSPKRRKAAAKLTGSVTTARLLSPSSIPPAKEYELFTYDEIMTGGHRTLIFDVESYPNYFEVGFKCTITGKVIVFEDKPDGLFINNQAVTPDQFRWQLEFVMTRFLLVGFNSKPYDLPICFVACQGVRATMLNQITDEIINQDMQPYEVARKYLANVPKINDIDLIEVAPLSAALKLYAGRLHCERMQDLPFPPHTVLEPWQIVVVKDYNINDLDNTQLLWEYLKVQIELREALGLQYGVDLRSKSDAQLAETVIVSELEKLGVKGKSPDIETGTQFFYEAPSYIEFKTPQFQQVLHTVIKTPFAVGAGGYADCPQEIEALKPKLGRGTYRLGAGGLHSSEKSAAYTADAETMLIDRDVASYYPYIILNNGFCPKHLGEPFLKVYRSIVDRRLQAKRTGDKATSESLKIVINGSFGKLGNRYSKFYSPDLLIQVTMTGQLCLLMLIEMIELAGIPVISANTDGIVIKCPKSKYELLNTVVIIWEEKTGFLTEETRYKGLYSRDVNNYIAVKYKEAKDAQGDQLWLDETDGCKTKGTYSYRGSALNSPLSKNPESYVCSMAVQAFLEHDTPLADTITSCRELKHFLNVRTVKGGAEKDGVYLGKAVRWYYAKDETGTINYVLTGNKVPKSEGAKPCMILPSEFPLDIDFDRYINEATDTLYDLGVYQKAKTGNLFES